MWGYDHGWMMNGWGMGGFGFIFWLVIVAVIIVGVVWFVRSQPLAGNHRRSTSLEVLEELIFGGSRARYAWRHDRVRDLRLLACQRL
jgi:uncharacterized membrane protein